MKEKDELKRTVVGPEGELSKEVRILSRRARWTEDGIQYACDRRHLHIVVSRLGMEGMKTLSSPGPTEILDCARQEDEYRERHADVRKRALERTRN